MTDRWTFQYLVGDLLKSTLHLYVPASFSVMPSNDKTAVGADLELWKRFFKYGPFHRKSSTGIVIFQAILAVPLSYSFCYLTLGTFMISFCRLYIFLKPFHMM